MGHSLNSFSREGYTGDFIGEWYRLVKGDTRSVDYSSHGK